MANEVSVAISGDLIAASVLYEKRLEYLLARQPFMEKLIPVAADIAGSGSAVAKIPQIKLDDVAEAVAEGSAISATTALTDGSYTLSPARQAIKRVITDLIDISSNLVDPEKLAQWNVAAIMLAFDGLVTAAAASFTGSVGVSGSALTVLQFQAAFQTLMERNAAGQIGDMYSILHERQVGDLQTDLLNYDTTLARRQDAQDMIALHKNMYKGSFMGVEIYGSNQVVDANAGADHNGFMFIEGGLTQARGTPRAARSRGGRVINPGTVVYTEFDVDTDRAEQTVTTNAFYAVSVSEAAKGIGIITDHV